MEIRNGARSRHLGLACVAAAIGLAAIGCSESSDSDSTPGAMLGETLGSVEAEMNEAVDRVGTGASQLAEDARQLADDAVAGTRESATRAADALDEAIEESADSARAAARDAGEAVTESIDSVGREQGEAQRALSRP